MQAGRCVVGYVQDDMYPLLKCGGHYARVWGCHVLFYQFHFESLSFGQASGIACFFLHIFSFHSSHRTLVGFRCWALVLFGGLLLGEGTYTGVIKKKSFFECLFASLLWGLTFFVFFWRGSYWVWSGRGRRAC